MLASARQLLAAGLERGTVGGTVWLLVAGAAQPAVGVRVGKGGQTVSPHAFGELTHLVHKGRVADLFMLATWGQLAARLLRGTERRVVLLLVAEAAEPPAGIRVGEVGHTVIAHALRKRERLLPVSGLPRPLAWRAAGCDQDEEAEQRRARRGRDRESPPAPSRIRVHRLITPSRAAVSAMCGPCLEEGRKQTGTRP